MGQIFWRFLACGILAAVIGSVSEYAMTDGVSGWVPLIAGLTGAVLGPLIVLVWPKVPSLFSGIWHKGKLLIGPGKLEKAKNDLTTAEAELSISKADLTIAETERDEYKRQVKNKKIEDAKILLSVSRQYVQQIEDKDRELSDLRGKYEVLQKEHGHAVLWAAGQECKSRGLSVAVQYVRIEDSELAKNIRSDFAYYLQGGYKHPSTEHINLPFNNPSMSARIVIFSDSDVGGSVKDAFNRYNLLDEKVAHFEKSLAGKLPEVDIAIVVFPSLGKEE